MPDNRYLKRRHDRWWFQMAVPTDLQASFGRKTVSTNLHTSSKREAMNLRWAHVTAWQAAFERARRGNGLTCDEIEEAAQAELQRTWSFMAADPMRNPDAMSDYLSTVIDSDKESLDLDALRPRAREIAQGFVPQPSPESIDTLAEALADAAFRAKAHWRHNIPPPDSRPQKAKSTAKGKQARRLNDAVDKYIEKHSNDPDARLTDSTLRQLRQTARLFENHMGEDVRLDTVTYEVAEDFLTRLSRLSKTYGRKAGVGAMSLSEIERRFPAGDGPALSNKTINRHASSLRALFSDQLPKGAENPFAGTSRKKPKGRAARARSYRPVTGPEIGQLLNAVPLVEEPAQTWREAMGWLIALGAYTGCRQAELATLDRADVVEHEGIACLHIQESKTEAGEDRLVPVHPDIIDAGFLDYVTRCRGRLFKVRPSDVPKRFAELRERCDVCADAKFHGLRKTFVRALENRGVDGDTIAQLVGHKRMFTVGTYNPDGPELRRLAECVQMIRFDGLTLRGVPHAAE